MPTVRVLASLAHATSSSLPPRTTRPLPALPTCPLAPGWDFSGRGPEAVTCEGLLPLLQRHQPDMQWDDKAEEHAFKYTVGYARLRKQ